MSVLIWIQTVWYSGSVLETVFLKKLILKSQQTRTEAYKLPSMQRGMCLRYTPDNAIIIFALSVSIIILSCTLDCSWWCITSRIPTFLPFDFDLWSCYILDHGIKVTQNVTQYPLHHVTYAPAKFEAATCTSDGLGDVFTRKIHYLTLTMGSRSHKMLPSTLCIMWLMHLQSLKLLHPTV